MANKADRRQKVLASWGLEGGPWERSQTNEHWGEECFPSPSSGASAASTEQPQASASEGPSDLHGPEEGWCVCVSSP